MPRDIVGTCSRVAMIRQVVVIMDSLDVLSLQRDHRTLQLFLSLIDRLSRIPSVTVIAACRSFDIEYHPLLRGRSWEKKVTLGLLDEAKEVAPLLLSWGVDPSPLNDDLKLLLRIPQNLRLFSSIARNKITSSIRTTYELLDAFLRETVIADSTLGSEAVLALQQMATELVQQRTKWLPIDSFRANEQVLRRLISQQILSTPVPQALAFSHQTLLESLVARAAIAKGTRLADFIRSMPPLPFVRPTVRAYVLHLSVVNPDRFGSQVNTALSDEKTAYHLRRLVAETLAEIDPKPSDWLWIREIYKKQSELFRRLMWRAKADGWFRLLKEQWLPEISSNEEAIWRREFLRHMDVWINRFGSECVELWTVALRDGWMEQNDLVRLICIQASRLERWPSGAAAFSLLQTLCSKSTEEHDFLGHAISRYVDATDNGDELLWQYVTARLDATDLSYNCEKNLRCDEHDFYRKEFFVDRLKRSDRLLSSVVESVQTWSARQRRRTDGMVSTFLFETSWRNTHHRDDVRHVNALNRLLQNLEDALKYHAMRDSDIWKKKEPELREAIDFGLQYILLQAYRAAPETNLPGIRRMLTNVDLLDDDHLSYELSALLRSASPFLDLSTQEAIQRTVLGLHEDYNSEEEGTPEWVWRQKFGYLISIPCIYRIPESQSFVDQWQRIFGNNLPEPHAFSGGGWVRPPVAREALVELSDGALIRLLEYYKSFTRLSNHPGDHLVGGRDGVESVLREAASRDPIRYLDAFHVLLRHGVDWGYLQALLDGVSSYLRYRAAHLRPPEGWQPAKPEESDEPVATKLLVILESYRERISDGRTFAHCLEGCANVLTDRDSVERVVFQLLFAAKYDDPTKERLRSRTEHERKDAHDLVTIGINSARGIAAKAAIAVAIRVFESNFSPPELLIPTLRRFARDPAAPVKATLFRRLPYLTHLNRDLGVRLFDDLLTEPDDLMWVLAELSLYYQYYKHFDWVKPRLERMLTEARETSIGAWARLSALASLAGHIKLGDLFATLRTLESDDAWAAAATVFASNLDHHDGTNVCHEALVRIIDARPCKKVMAAVDRMFDHESNYRFIKDELAVAFITTDFNDTERLDWFHFCEWLESVAVQDAARALGAHGARR